MFPLGTVQAAKVGIKIPDLTRNQTRAARMIGKDSVNYATMADLVQINRFKKYYSVRTVIRLNLSKYTLFLYRKWFCFFKLPSTWSTQDPALLQQQSRIDCLDEPILQTHVQVLHASLYMLANYVFRTISTQTIVWVPWIDGPEGSANAAKQKITIITKL